MDTPGVTTDDLRWNAVLQNHQEADGVFVYAVKTTGVYCKPSCSSRTPNRQNVLYFESFQDAEVAGFRACLRCRPSEPENVQKVPSAILKACRMMEHSVTELSLKELATSVGLSHSHFHQLFKSATGVTPKEYRLEVRSRRLQKSLIESETVTEAIYASGFSSSSRFYTDSKKILGMTPKQYRNRGAQEVIRFALGQCDLGAICIAVTQVGVCSIALGENAANLLEDLQENFSNARLIGDDKQYQEYIAKVVHYVEGATSNLQLPLDVRGTAFQRRVWNALQKIAPGETLTYSKLAEEIGAPKSVRAVACACAANKIALAIPCHRVVRLDGSPSGYRWGLDRKSELIRREKSRRESQ